MQFMNVSNIGSLQTVIDQVNQNADFTIIACNDTPSAVVMSFDAFNSLMETIHLLKNPANAEHLFRSIEQDRQGEILQRNIVDA